MKFRFDSVASAFILTTLLAVVASAQTTGSTTAQGRGPSSPVRQFIVMKAQSVAEVERKLHPATNKGEELIGGEGMELRVVVQHENNLAPAAAEIHDASDDVYYVLEGKAMLTLGGRLEAPEEIEPGEWRGPRIEGGRNFEVRKGDLVIVPRGTPHMRSTVGKDFAMLLVKVFDKPLPAPRLAPAPTPQKP
ncbi:MAG: cupin domain-containing protein [Acidobacteria bacterium]|nr:cupin domain-containing protein [Acidobacteriota bacterium]